MYPVVVCIFILGLCSMIPTYLFSYDEIRKDSQAVSLASNFCVYRKAVCEYISGNDNVVNIPNASLPLPEGYIYLSGWQSRIIGEYCYIFGEIEENELYIIRKNLGNSLLVGINQGGSLYPSGVVVPQNIPNGVIVSIVSAEQ